MKALFTLAFVVALAGVSCKHGDLRGTYEPSRDGNTYLEVVDGNGGACGPIKVDGKVWSHPIGKPGLVDPGDHTISCGFNVGFHIPKGVVYKFDYWGHDLLPGSGASFARTIARLLLTSPDHPILLYPAQSHDCQVFHANCGTRNRVFA